MSNTYKILFRGELHSQQPQETVISEMAKLFRKTSAQIEPIFSGKDYILKKHLSEAEVSHYVTALESIGLKVYVEPEAEQQQNNILPSLLTPDEFESIQQTTFKPKDTPPLATAPQCHITPLENEESPLSLIKEDINVSTVEPTSPFSSQSNPFQPSPNNTHLTPENPYRNPTANLVGITKNIDKDIEVEPPRYLALSLEGRWGRISFFNSWAIHCLTALLMVVFAGFISGVFRSDYFAKGLLPIPLLCYIWWRFRAYALRMHDLNWGAMWVIPILILNIIGYLSTLREIKRFIQHPSTEALYFSSLSFKDSFGITIAFLISAIAFLVLFFFPGKTKNNHYGAPPQQGSAQLCGIICIAVIISISTSGLPANHIENIPPSGNPSRFTNTKGVIMYSLSTCGYCNQKREQLKREGIPFKEYFIDRDSTQLAALEDKLRASGYKSRSVGTPTFDVNGTMLPNNPDIATIKEYLHKGK